MSALVPGQEQGLQVYTTEPFEPGDEMLCDVFFTGLDGKIMVRAIGKRWHQARPRMRVRAGGLLRFIGSEWRKLEFLREVAIGRIPFQQRRRYLRQPVLVEIRWRRPGETELIPATLTEISEVGALLLTPSPLAVGELIVVEITPPGSTRSLPIHASVRNTDHLDGVGLEFTNRDIGGVTLLRELIRRFVDE